MCVAQPRPRSGPLQEADAGAADGAPPQAPADGAGPSQRPPRPANYSRKSRSLGLLCENFLARFGREAGSIINVDTAAKELGVERRRIYDILNVLHSLGVTEKRMKGQ
jgi:transcription factor E2F7/8